MKIYKALFLISLLYACNQQDDSEKTGFEIIQPEAPEKDSVIIEEVDDEENAIMPVVFFAEDMPSVWIQLTDNSEVDEAEYEEGYSIYNMCFSEQQQFWFESGKGDDWILTMLYGQDSEDFYVNNFSAILSEKELYMVVDGSFTMTSIYNDTNVKQVTFWWNKDISFACFEGIYNEALFYVPEENQDKYELVSEICEEPY